jgi:hypothetical protein
MWLRALNHGLTKQKEKGFVERPYLHVVLLAGGL